MKAAIGVYDTHEKAIEAVEKLKTEGFTVTHLSILGKMDSEVVADDELHLVPENPIKAAGLETGTALGLALGVLTGVGLFAIPGFGFLYGAGALAGAVAGFDFGLMGGGIASVLITAGVKDDLVKKYKQYLEEGKYLLVAKGTEDEAERAKRILAEHDTHHALDIH